MQLLLNECEEFYQQNSLLSLLLCQHVNCIVYLIHFHDLPIDIDTNVTCSDQECKIFSYKYYDYLDVWEDPLSEKG